MRHARVFLFHIEGHWSDWEETTKLIDLRAEFIFTKDKNDPFKVSRVSSLNYERLQEYTNKWRKTKRKGK